MRTLLLAIPIALYISCGKKEINTSVLIHGKIENPTTDILSVSNQTDKFTTSIDSSGNFELRFEIEKADYFDLKQIPHLKKLEEEFRGRNIIFLSISLDNNNEKWKNMVIEKGLNGIHIRASEGWKSQFVKDYKIRNVPTFILIDREQNIIDARALRPSENVSEVLNNLEEI